MTTTTSHRAGPTDITHPPHPDWARWDTAWTTTLRQVTGRDDLTAVVAPGAGGGAPACYYPHQARVEVDATHIGHPAVTDPRKAAHKRDIPVAYGLLLHEAAHATHSQWTTPPGTPPIVAEVADLLEEARAEAQHRTRRPRDRAYLKATVTALVHPGHAPVDTPWHAATLAALLLARVDARILAAKDIRTVRDAVTTILGRHRLHQLRQIWRQALQVDDDDATTMTQLAERWCHTLGLDPRTHPRTPTADPGNFTGRLAAAVAGWAAAATGLSLPDYLAATATGHTPHTAGPGPRAPAGWARRDPTTAERQAAHHLATRLATARATQPEPGRAPSPTPPGRLRTRQAITAQAQRAAGQTPTAAPFTRRAPQPPDKPELRLAVLVDVSGSMRDFAAPMSAAAWILAHAARGNHATTTTIAFGATTTLIHHPGHRPTQVLDMAARGGTDTFIPALKLADQLLDLRRPGPTRIVAVVSDGDLTDPGPAQHLITTLHQHGVTVLWLHPENLPGHTYTHTTTVTNSDPTTTITPIADAITTALANS